MTPLLSTVIVRRSPICLIAVAARKKTASVGGVTYAA